MLMILLLIAKIILMVTGIKLFIVVMVISNT